MELFETSLQLIVQDYKVYLFIDALDECGAEGAKKLIRDLQAMLLRLSSADGKFLLRVSAFPELLPREKHMFGDTCPT